MYSFPNCRLGFRSITVYYYLLNLLNLNYSTAWYRSLQLIHVWTWMDMYGDLNFQLDSLMMLKSFTFKRKLQICLRVVLHYFETTFGRGDEFTVYIVVTNQISKIVLWNLYPGNIKYDWLKQDKRPTHPNVTFQTWNNSKKMFAHCHKI